MSKSYTLNDFRENIFDFMDKEAIKILSVDGHAVDPYECLLGWGIGCLIYFALKMTHPSMRDLMSDKMLEHLPKNVRMQVETYSKCIKEEVEDPADTIVIKVGGEETIH